MNPSKYKKEMNKKEDPPKTPSMEDNRKKLASVHEKIYYVDSARIGFLLCVAFLSIFAIFNLWQSMKIMGMRLCYFLLISHSLSFLGFAIIHYHFLPPLVDESNTLGRQINEGEFCKPAYHPSKIDMFCYCLKILIALLTNAGIWIKLTSMDFPYDSIPSTTVADTCGYLGLLQTAVSLYVVASMGPVVTRLDTETQKTAQDTVMSEKDAFYNQVLREEEEVSLEQDKILQEKDARYCQLLQAKDLVLEEKERVIQAKDLVLEEREKELQQKNKALQQSKSIIEELLDEKTDENKRK